MNGWNNLEIGDDDIPGAGCGLGGSRRRHCHFDTFLAYCTKEDVEVHFMPMEDSWWNVARSEARDVVGGPQRLVG